MIWVLFKRVICGILACANVNVILACANVNVIKHVKLMNIWILKIFPCQKRLIDKLALECEDKILNTTEPNDIIRIEDFDLDKF